LTGPTTRTRYRSGRPERHPPFRMSASRTGTPTLVRWATLGPDGILRDHLTPNVIAYSSALDRLVQPGLLVEAFDAVIRSATPDPNRWVVESRLRTMCSRAAKVPYAETAALESLLQTPLAPLSHVVPTPFATMLIHPEPHPTHRDSPEPNPKATAMLRALGRPMSVRGTVALFSRFEDGPTLEPLDQRSLLRVHHTLFESFDGVEFKRLRAIMS